MTMERVDSPLAGRRPGNLSSVPNHGSVGSMGSVNSLGSVGSMGSLSSMGSMGGNVNAVSSMGSVGSGPVGSIGSVGSVGQLSGLGSLGSGGSVIGSGVGSGVGSGPGTPLTSLGASSGAADSRTAAPFWLELKGVERWFDTLDQGERMTLMTSLFARSPEHQLHRYSATIEKALHSVPSSASNLSRFGVAQKGQSAASTAGSAASHSDVPSAFRFHSPMAGAQTGSGSATPGSSAQAGGNSSSASTSQSGTSGGNQSRIPAPLSVGATKSGNSSVQGGSNNSAGQGSFMSPLSAPMSGSFSSSLASTGDLYSQAFLPLPRTQAYSPWGHEIRRPKSATADAWPDATTSRVSPTLQSSTTASGSPAPSALSLEAPSYAPVGQGPSVHSPIGHPVKPWRTFTPHQPSNVGIGQAPDPPTNTQSSSLANNAPGPISQSSSSMSAPASSAASIAAPGTVTPSISQQFGSAAPGTSSASIGNLGSSSSDSGSVGLTGTPPFGGRASLGAGVNSASGNSGAESAPGSPSSARGSAALTKDQRQGKRGANAIDVGLLSDIGAWLRSLRLHKYTGNLAGMRWQDVIQLNDADLEARGVNALGARRKLLKMFEEIRAAQEAGQIPGETSK